MLGLVLLVTSSGAVDDEIRSLPMFNRSLNFRQYSGYVPVGPDDAPRVLHYWMVESERSWSSDPLVLWLNGGTHACMYARTHACVHVCAMQCRRIFPLSLPIQYLFTYMCSQGLAVQA